MEALGQALISLLVVLVALAVIGCGVVTGMKGKWGVVALVLVFGWLAWIVGACRLAKPDSYWARRFYDEGKLRRAAQRAGWRVEER